MSDKTSEEQDWSDGGFCKHHMYVGEMCGKCLEEKDIEIARLNKELEVYKNKYEYVSNDYVNMIAAFEAGIKEAVERIQIHGNRCCFMNDMAYLGKGYCEDCKIDKYLLSRLQEIVGKKT